MVVIDHGRGRAVVGRLVLPGERAVVGIEGVEVEAAEAAAEEDPAIHDGRARQRVTTGKRHLPAAEPPVLALERSRHSLAEVPFKSGVDLHK